MILDLIGYIIQRQVEVRSALSASAQILCQAKQSLASHAKRSFAKCKARFHTASNQPGGCRSL